MQSRRTDPTDHQERIDRHFEAVSLHWRDVYRESTLEGLIHRDRLSLALSWIDELGVQEGARALDIGCGAGVLAIALARRGYEVGCIDSSSSMVELAQVEVGMADLSGSVVVATGDAHSLEFATESCDVVVALGVIPYLHSPLQALTEMARVLKPGGHVIISSDNVYRLNHVLDPRYSPLLPGRRALKSALRRLQNAPPEGLKWHLYSLPYVQTLLRQANLKILNGATLGFGRFTLLGKRVFSEKRTIAIHRWLQELADRRSPVVRAVGAQHLLLARKPEVDTNNP